MQPVEALNSLAVTYANLFAASLTPVAVFSTDHGLSYANPAFYRLGADRPTPTRLPGLCQIPVITVLKTSQPFHLSPRKQGTRAESVLPGTYSPITDEYDNGCIGVLYIGHIQDMGRQDNAALPRPRTLASQDSLAYAVFDQEGTLNLFGQGLDLLLPIDHRQMLYAACTLSQVLQALTETSERTASHTILHHLQRRNGMPADFATQDGRTLQLSLSERDNEQTLLKVKDISESRAQESHMDRQTRLLRLLSDAQTAIISGHRHTSAFRKFLSGLLRIAECHSAMVAGIRGNAFHDVAEIIPLSICGTWEDTPSPDLCNLIQQDLSTAEPYSPDLPMIWSGQNNSVLLPILIKDTPVGCLVLADRPSLFDEKLLLELTPILPTLAAMIMAHTNAKYRQQSSSELRSQHKRTRAIMETINEAIISTDHTGVVLDMNTAAERMFGYRLTDLLGRSVSALSPHSAGSPFHALDRHATTDGTPFAREETLCLRHNGRIFPAKYAIRKIELEDNPQFILIITDTSNTTKPDLTARKK